MNIRSVHRGSAVVVGTYAAAHIVNHLLGLLGAAVHQNVMEGLRHVYRFAPVELLLLAAVSIQVATGLWMFFSGLRRRRGALAWVQASSGFVLSGFLLIHVMAVVYGRTQLRLDTNLFYAAAGMQLPQTRTFFGPYYFAGVLALFVHVGCALYRLRQRKVVRESAGAMPSPVSWVGAWSVAGVIVAAALVLLLAGVITAVNVPQKYLATFQTG